VKMDWFKTDDEVTPVLKRNKVKRVICPRCDTTVWGFKSSTKKKEIYFSCLCGWAKFEREMRDKRLRDNWKD